MTAGGMTAGGRGNRCTKALHCPFSLEHFQYAPDDQCLLHYVLFFGRKACPVLRAVTPKGERAQYWQPNGRHPGYKVDMMNANAVVGRISDGPCVTSIKVSPGLLRSWTACLALLGVYVIASLS